MSFIRWIVVGAVIFASGLLFLLLEVNERVGFVLGFAGFALILYGLVERNWVASRLVESRSSRWAHRVSVIGFCVAVLGIIANDEFPALGSGILALGVAIIVVGAVAGILAARNKE